MEYFIYATEAGVPKTGLSISWASLTDSGGLCGGGSEAGTDKSASAPTIYEVGGGFYKCDIAYGSAPWDTVTRELLGVLDLGSSLAGADRYRPVVITLRGLGLARIAHKGVQNKTTGDIDIYATDGSSKEMTLDMTDAADAITRNPSAPG